MVGALDGITEAFRNGGGVPQSDFDPKMWDAMERYSGSWFENFLCQVWIPAMPDVQSKLEGGAKVTDIGCGRGRALIKMAQAFPKSQYKGYDDYGPTVDLASGKAKKAGVETRVSFQELDASKGLPEKYDIITTFDVVHDAVDPQGLLRSIRQAMKDDGIYVCLDMNCSDNWRRTRGRWGACFIVSACCTA